VKTRVSPTTVYGLPPYSSTRFRAFQTGGSASAGGCPGVAYMMATRPPSSGWPSAHHTRPPASSTHAGPPLADAASSAVMGDSQVPYGAIVVTQ
jgi:hypothetical protein